MDPTGTERTWMPGAATWQPWKCVSSLGARSSMGIRDPSGHSGSSVCVGAAMKNGTLAGPWKTRVRVRLVSSWQALARCAQECKCTLLQLSSRPHEAHQHLGPALASLQRRVLQASPCTDNHQEHAAAMHYPPPGHKRLLTKGMHTGGMARPQRRALTASDSVPILLAVFPLPTMRSAPDVTNRTTHNLKNLKTLI